MAGATAAPKGKQRIRVATGIYRKPNGKYLATFRDPGRTQRWKEFRTKAEAQRWRARALLDPSSVAAGRRTLNEVWEKLLEHHGGKLRPTTRSNWQQEWRAHIGPALGNWPVSRISVLALKEFLADLEGRGVGAPTRAKCRAILHRVLEEAVENGEIPANPAAAKGTRVRRDQPKKARILTPAEVAAAVSATRKVASDSDALAMELMFFLGLRIGEMAGLQARDVVASRGEIVIRRTVSDAGGHIIVQDATKTSQFRTLPIPEELALWDRLLVHLKSRGLIGQAQVFQSSHGAVLRPNNWRRRVWDRAMSQAAIEDPPTPHSGRRTTASLLSAAGVPPATVQAILGHSTLQQTGEYIDVPRADLEAGLKTLSEVYTL